MDDPGRSMFVEEPPDAPPPNAPWRPADPGQAGPVPPEEVHVSPPLTAEVIASLERIERLLGELRSTLSLTVRERRHQEFSIARLLASLAQALVLGLVLWAIADGLFAEARDVVLVKLGFATVFQLAALTGFVLGREVE